jgi:hypothetical protein
LLARVDLAEPHKLEIVARLGELPSPAVKHFLGALVSDGKLAKGSTLERAVRDTFARIAEPKPMPKPNAPEPRAPPQAKP